VRLDNCRRYNYLQRFIKCERVQKVLLRTPPLLMTLRPKQWAKNLLVFTAPLAAGGILRGNTLSRTVIAFVAFCFISSVGYIINDLKDIERDRKNPKKSKRPLASGSISKTQAIGVLVLSAILGMAAASALSLSFQITLLCYLALTLSYSFGLKHQPVVELLIVALGFVMRAIGGGAATNTPISKWFLVVATFGSLVIVTAKRLAEAESLADVDVRPVIRQYPLPFLRFVLAVSAGVTLTGYSLWAFSLPESKPYAQISLLPVCLGLFRYVWLVEKGEGEIPEDLLLHDVMLVASGVVTALLLFFSVY
jgi:decaprenyl-phosphate phosphoribosyltransferase